MEMVLAWHEVSEFSQDKMSNKIIYFEKQLIDCFYSMIIQYYGIFTG
jgi:hypothetical protein